MNYSFDDPLEYPFLKSWQVRVEKVIFNSPKFPLSDIPHARLGSPHQLHVECMQDTLGQAYTQLWMELLAQKETTTEDWPVFVPVNWWEHLKHTLRARGWTWIKPAKTTRIAVAVTKVTYNICPHLPTDSDHKHVNFFMCGKSVVREAKGK